MTYSNGIHASRLLYLYIYEGQCSEDGSLSFDQHYQACSSCDITGNWEFMQFLIFFVDSYLNDAFRLVRPPSPVPLPAEELNRSVFELSSQTPITSSTICQL